VWDAEALKKAFRKAVKANHPDLHPDDPNAPLQFQQIVAANALLRDAKQRATYNRLLELERVRSQSSQTPPRGFWVDLLLPPDRADDVLFNLLGRYDYWVQKHGFPKGRIIFAVQLFGCVLSFWTEWLLKLLALLRKP
jgi:curved DNA-binding protein CbpA